MADLQSIAKALSGELELEKEQERKVRREQVKQKKRDQSIESGKAHLDSSNSDGEKIVQNIKIYDWEAPIRLKISFEKKTYLAVVMLSAVFVVYLVILGQYGLMGALIALLFFIYVSGVYEPIKIKNRITTRGIETPISIEEDKDILSISHLYEWYIMEDFCFYKRNDEFMLVIRTKLRFPPKLMLIVSEDKIKPIFKLLEDRVLYRDNKKPSIIDKLVYGQYIKLEEILKK